MYSDELIRDFAILTYLKHNKFTNHERQIYAEAYERVTEFGRGIVEAEVISREYARLKQLVLDFETIHNLS